MLTASVNPSIQLFMLNEQHVDALSTLTLNNQDYLSQWLPWAIDYQGISDTQAFIDNAQCEYQAKQAEYYVIFYQAQLCGVINLFNLNAANQSCELGYWLDAECQGHGIMTQTVAFLSGYSFNTLCKNKIMIRAAEHNQASRRIPERLGFHLDGLLREHERLGDAYVSHAIYSLLKREWQF